MAKTQLPPNIQMDEHAPGSGEVNESTPANQRASTAGRCPKSEGPRRGETGNYQPAEYPVETGAGDKKVTIIRRDM